MLSSKTKNTSEEPDPKNEYHESDDHLSAPSTAFGQPLLKLSKYRRITIENELFENSFYSNTCAS